VGARGLFQGQHLGDPRAQAPCLEVGGQGAQLLGASDWHEDGLEAELGRRLGGLRRRVKTAIAQGGVGAGPPW
jgi:hypothetical protein